MDLQQALSDRELTQEKLFSIYEAALRENFPAAEIEAYPPEKFEVKLPGREVFTIYIKNLWVKLKRETTADRIKVFEHYLRSMQTVLAEDTPPSPRREAIVPMIKDSEYMAFISENPSLLREHLAGDIWIVYAMDLPEAIVTLKPETMQQLGVTTGELRALACDNLRRILPEIEQQGSGPWYFLTAGGDYVASILLLDEVWVELRDSIEGDIVAAVPARDVLLFTGSRSREGIEAIKQKARDIEGHGDHVISQTLLRRVSGVWKVFE